MSRVARNEKKYSRDKEEEEEERHKQKPGSRIGKLGGDPRTPACRDNTRSFLLYSLHRPRCPPMANPQPPDPDPPRAQTPATAPDRPRPGRPRPSRRRPSQRASSGSSRSTAAGARDARLASSPSNVSSDESSAHRCELIACASSGLEPCPSPDPPDWDRQYADTPTFVKTLHLFTTRPPSLIIVPPGDERGTGPKDEASSMLVRSLQAAWPDVPIVPVSRKFWNEQSGELGRRGTPSGDAKLNRPAQGSSS